jgi:hypothetical protein
MTSAAAASPQATAGPKAAAIAATAIGGDWEGIYTCGSAATGLDLTIQAPLSPVPGRARTSVARRARPG